MYNMNTFENCLKWVVYINTLSSCNTWIGMEICSTFLLILVTTMYFKDRKLISKTVYCYSCSMVCKIFFAPNSPIFRIRLEEKQEEEEHRQLQNVMRFTQTQ